MTKLLSLLQGRKTYITGIVMIVLGLLQNDTTLMLEGLGLIFLRNGVAVR